MNKCFCHFSNHLEFDRLKGNGYEVKDAKARNDISKLSSNIIYADMVGFIKFNTLEEANSYTDNTNDDLYNQYCTENSKIVFGNGYYPFNNKCKLYPRFEIEGNGGSNSVLVFNNYGFVADEKLYYQEIYFHDFSIISESHSIDIVNDKVNFPLSLYKNKFRRLKVNSLNGDCFHSYVGRNANNTDVLQFENEFEDIMVTAPNGAGFNGFYSVLTIFRRISDVGNQTPYIFRNCGGKFVDCNTSFSKARWFLYWDDQTTWNSFDLIMEKLTVVPFKDFVRASVLPVGSKSITNRLISLGIPMGF